MKTRKIRNTGGIKDSMGENEEIIQLEHEEFLEMIGFTPEQIEEDRRTVQIIDYNTFLARKKKSDSTVSQNMLKI